tara:strand:- start:480 stop:1115 length:636 start_codon:yes stop_codon:yes gene_type:complete
MEKEETKDPKMNNQETLGEDIEDDSNNTKEEKEISSEDKIKNLEDKLSRTLAEMENQRRRFEKERDEAFEYGGFSFAKEALNLIDNLERSKLSLENDEELKNNKFLKKISEHLEVIYKDTLSIFKKNNIKQIKSINEKLDPNFHQAMLEIEDDSKEPGTIVQEVQKGFLMKDRLLRPSLVGVSKKTVKKDQNNEFKSKNTNENNEKEDKNN